MTTKVLMTVILLTRMFFLGFAQTNQLEFTIHGTVQNMNNVNRVYLYNGDHVIDSAEISDNRYQFKGQLPYPTKLSLKQNGSRSLNIMVNKGDIVVVSTGSLKSSVVDGPGAAMQKEWEKTFARSNSIRDTLVMLHKDPNLHTNPGLMSKMHRLELLELSTVSLESINYVKRNPASPMNPQIIMGLEVINQAAPQFKVSTELMDSLISTLTEPYKTKARDGILMVHKEALTSRNGVNTKTLIGQPAIRFSQNDPDGKAVNLDSFRGKYVLVDFWASWCAPCRSENPNVVKAYQQYKNKGFEILGVSLDGSETKNAWLEAIKKDNLNWTQVSDLKGWANSVAKLYGVTAIPQNFLIDPNGVIVAENLRGEELNKKLATLFK